MRTTIELPDSLLKRAKIAAVERGTTLRELIGAALARELDVDPETVVAPKPVRFPLFSSQRPGSLALSAEDLAASEVNEDVRRHGISR